MSEKIVQLDLFSEKSLTPLEKLAKGLRGSFVRLTAMQAGLVNLKRDQAEMEALFEEISLAEKEKSLSV